MKLLIMVASLLLIISGAGWIGLDPAPHKQLGSSVQYNQAAKLDKHQYSIDDPGSIWVIVNKVRPLQPLTYAPNDLVAPNVPLRLSADMPEMQLRQEMATAMEQMFNAAKKTSVTLMLASGYRSYDEQVAVYNSEIEQFGQAKADTESARPGRSEHQTGLAADIEPTNRECEIDDCFALTAEGKWLAANAYKYGFILRYTPDKVSITGYRYEPWHVRYVGPELANAMRQQGITTLEEFFNVIPASQPY